MRRGRCLIGPREQFCAVWEISPCGASIFLSDQKDTKESPGADSPCQGEMSRSDRGGRDRGFWERPAAYALVFHEPLSPGPPIFYGGARGVRGQSRPARKPHEGCLNIIAAALLS